MEVSSFALDPGTKIVVDGLNKWSLSSEVFGSMLWVCSQLGVGHPLANLVGFAYFLDCLGQVISKRKLSLGAAKLFILFVEIRPDQFSSTKVDFIDRMCHKSQWVQSESKERWHISLANSLRLTFQTLKFVCQTNDWMHTLKHAIFNLLHPQVPRFWAGPHFSPNLRINPCTYWVFKILRPFVLGQFNAWWC